MQYTYLFQFVLINKKQRRSEKFPSAIIPPPLNYNIAYIKSLIPRQPPWGQKEPQHDHPPIWPQVHSVQNGRRLFAHWAKQPDTWVYPLANRKILAISREVDKRGLPGSDWMGLNIYSFDKRKILAISSAADKRGLPWSEWIGLNIFW